MNAGDDPAGDRLELADGLVWRGTDDEASQLQGALDAACQSQGDDRCPDDWINDACPIHAVLNDQTTLDAWLHLRRVARVLV